jgi:hypothetical protein
MGLAAQVAGPVFGGAAEMSRARGIREQEKVNAEIGRIRADQTDTSARTGLESELAEYRAVLSANDAPASVATLGLLNTVRDRRERDRRITVGNRRQESRDATRRAEAKRPGLALTSGVLRGMPSLFELYGELR